MQLQPASPIDGVKVMRQKIRHSVNVKISAMYLDEVSSAVDVVERLHDERVANFYAEVMANYRHFDQP